MTCRHRVLNVCRNPSLPNHPTYTSNDPISSSSTKQQTVLYGQLYKDFFEPRLIHGVVNIFWQSGRSSISGRTYCSHHGYFGTKIEPILYLPCPLRLPIQRKPQSQHCLFQGRYRQSTSPMYLILKLGLAFLGHACSVQHAC
jgi:hypothetical protein